MYWVYVLKSEKFNKSYVGYTDNIDRRFMEHSTGKGRFTKTYLPWKLIHTETFADRFEAIKREKFLKSKVGRKFLTEFVFK